MHFFPHFPLAINSFALFGLMLLLGLIGGELIKFSRSLPRILGYIAIGFLVGPGGINLVSPSLLADTHMLISISLGLILFDLGRHLDFAWLRADKGLIFMSLAESGLTFVFIFTLFFLFGLPWLPATLAAAIAVASSPAIIIMIANDLSSKGPVTRRTLILTSLNNLFGLTLFSVLLPMTQASSHPGFAIAAHSIYRFFGSILFGFLMFAVTRILAYLTGKNKETQFVLIVSMIILTISFSKALHLSSMFSLFTLGVTARNFDKHRVLMEVNLGRIAYLFFIPLFVVMGANLNFHGFFQSLGIVLTFLFIRTLAKASGIWFFAKRSRLTKKQVFSITLALFPLTDVVIGMTNTLSDFNPDLGSFITTTLFSAVAIMNIIGPILTQWAFIYAGENMTGKDRYVNTTSI